MIPLCRFPAGANLYTLRANNHPIQTLIKCGSRNNDCSLGPRCNRITHDNYP